uniref:hypothetical protein n=1 Tax=Thaumasiovibrio occultus TaxID=1891184 RepID=UPI00131BFCCF|nr:hypothetical protein [Thaumasiovibrio occultus]
MDEIIDYIFGLPGTILIKPEDMSFDYSFQFGVQNEGHSKRFASVFGTEEHVLVYFKHDINSVEQLYKKHPDIIVPSDVAAKYWSKANITKMTDLDEIKSLISSSREMILDKYSKKTKQSISGISSENKFRAFHTLSTSISKSNNNVYYKINDYESPSLSYHHENFATFNLNWLYLTFKSSKVILDDVDFVEVDSSDTKTTIALSSENSFSWKKALNACLKSYLKHGKADDERLLSEKKRQLATEKRLLATEKYLLGLAKNPKNELPTKLEKLLPAEGKDHHRITGLTIENKTIEIGNGKNQDVIVNSTLNNCVIRIKCGARQVNIFNSSLLNCVIWPARQMNGLRLAGLEMVGCKFKGRYFDCRFGNEQESDQSNVRDCDFSEAKLFHLCDFREGTDAKSCKFPKWPHIILTDLSDSSEDWLSLDLSQEFRSIQRVIAESGHVSSAASIHLPSTIDDPEKYKALLKSRPYILIS